MSPPTHEMKEPLIERAKYAICKCGSGLIYHHVNYWYCPNNKCPDFKKLREVYK